jgi:hypothetical protein
MGSFKEMLDHRGMTYEEFYETCRYRAGLQIISVNSGIPIVLG